MAIKYVDTKELKGSQLYPEGIATAINDLKLCREVRFADIDEFWLRGEETVGFSLDGGAGYFGFITTVEAWNAADDTFKAPPPVRRNRR